MPASGARHRPLKTKTGIGKFMNKKKLKKGRAFIFKTMHVGLGRQLKEAKVILAEEDVPIDCSPPCGQEPPKENFTELVLLAAVGVGKCQGCKGKF